MRDRPTEQHRKVAEQKLGRPIASGYDIDHRNENKDDNSPGNLQELSHAAHSTKTGKRENRTLRKLQGSLMMTLKKEKLY